MGTFGIDIIKTDLNGIYENAICGENINKGEICYLGSDQKYYLAKADNISTCSTELRVALEDSLQNNFSKFLISGKINISTSLIPGNLYYISDNISGSMEEDINNISLTSYVRKIGTAYSEYTLEFNPDETVIKKSGVEINKLPLPESSETTKGIADYPMMREAVASADTVTELLTGDEILIKRLISGVPTLFKASKDLFGGGSSIDTKVLYFAYHPSAIIIRQETPKCYIMDVNAIASNKTTIGSLISNFSNFTSTKIKSVFLHWMPYVLFDFDIVIAVSLYPSGSNNSTTDISAYLTEVGRFSFTSILAWGKNYSVVQNQNLQTIPENSKLVWWIEGRNLPVAGTDYTNSKLIIQILGE